MAPSAPGNSSIKARTTPIGVFFIDHRSEPDLAGRILDLRHCMHHGGEAGLHVDRSPADTAFPREYPVQMAGYPCRFPGPCPCVPRGRDAVPGFFPGILAITFGRPGSTSVSHTSMFRSSKNPRTQVATSRSPGPPHSGLTLLIRTSSESIWVTSIAAKHRPGRPDRFSDCIRAPQCEGDRPGASREYFSVTMHH